MSTKKSQSKPDGLALSAITIEGFKSIRTKRTMPLAALNVVAGANSSGKSSFLQPLLLIKQTLEAPYETGPLLIDGSNIKFSEHQQIFSINSPQKLNIGLTRSDQAQIELFFSLDASNQIQLDKNSIRTQRGNQTKIQNYQIGTSSDTIKDQLTKGDAPYLDSFFKTNPTIQVAVARTRCLFSVTGLAKNGPWEHIPQITNEISAFIANSIIHVPGLRGTPERSYRKSAISNRFPGTFDTYVASILTEWQDQSNQKLVTLGLQLKDLGLTSGVIAKKLDDTRVELKVGRLAKAMTDDTSDYVSIADVGLGVSQVLPVLVALLVAKEGQFVYIEQPEIHLHPRAQRALARVFVDAIKTGAQVIVETHSSLFLREIQTLVAMNEVDKSLVKLHWVTRDAMGDTELQTCELDEAGRYGDWPQDFDETASQSAVDYFQAAEAVLFKNI